MDSAQQTRAHRSFLSRREVLAGAVSCLAMGAVSAETPGSSNDELDKIKALFKRPEPNTWVLTGDSITHGALHTWGQRSYVEHFAERVRFELDRLQDMVINSGTCADRVPDLLKDLRHRVLRFEPTVVSVMLGMNDVRGGPDGREPFRQAYNELIDRLRQESKALILLQTPNPITEVDKRRTDLPAYVEIIREIAAKQTTALVDQDKMWREYLSKGRGLMVLLNDGSIHPNGYGHILMARNMFKVLGIDDPNAPTGRFFVP